MSDTQLSEIDRELDPDSKEILHGLTLLFATVIVIIMVFDRSGRLVAWMLKRRKKKAEKLQAQIGQPDSTAETGKE